MANHSVLQCFFWQPGRNLLDFLFHVVNHLQGIGSITGNHHATHHLGSVFVQSTTPRCRPQANHPDILDAHGTILRNSHHRFLQVSHIFHVAQATHQVFSLVNFDGFGTDISVRLLHRLHYLVQRNVISFQGVRVDIDLIFLHKATDGSHFRNTFGSIQSIFYVEVLN